MNPTRRPSLDRLCGLLLCILLSHPVLGQKAGLPPTEHGKIAAHGDLPQRCLMLFANGVATWDTAWRETHTYALNGDLVETVREDFVSGGWEMVNRRLLTWSAGHLDEVLDQEWDSVQWENVSRNIWLPDALGNDTVHWTLLWVSGNATWDTTGGDRQRYTYRSDGQPTRVESAYRTPFNTWADVSRNDYYYDAQNRWDSLVYSNYSGLAWQPVSRLVQVVWHDYDARQVASYKLQSFAGAWVDTQRQTCDFGPLQYQCLVETSDSSVWDTAFRETHAFDQHDHEIGWEREEHQGGPLWLVSAGEEYHYHYDSLGHTLDLLTKVWDGSTAYEDLEWRLYGQFFVGVPSPTEAALAVEVFPNPCTDRLNIRMEGAVGRVTCRLYDLQGRLRMRSDGPLRDGGYALRVSELLETGSYVLVVETARGSARRRVEVVR